MPGPRNAVPLERLALSKLALKMNGMSRAGGHLFELTGHVECSVRDSIDAGSGDQEEGPLEPNVKPAQLHAAAFSLRSA